jgi:hypothetical protein
MVATLPVVRMSKEYTYSLFKGTNYYLNLSQMLVPTGHKAFPAHGEKNRNDRAII